MDFTDVIAMLLGYGAIFLVALLLLGTIAFLATLGLKPEHDYAGFWKRSVFTSLLISIPGLFGAFASATLEQEGLLAIPFGAWLFTAVVMRQVLKWRYRDRDKTPQAAVSEGRKNAGRAKKAMDTIDDLF